ISLRLLAATDRIILNAAELKISSATIQAKSGTSHNGKPELDEENERLTVKLDKAIPPGEWILTVGFSGILNDKLHGFYRSVFTDSEGNQRTIATTQFEATDARRAFPCWDEPDRKAVFSIALEVPNELNAYSNSPIVSEEALNSTKRLVKFADSPKMSTYLVAFVVGPLEASDPVDVDGVALSIVYPPGKEHMTGFAIQIGAHSLKYFTEWFGIAYPGQKLDLIAIPDFAFGAMENFGAVTFRETALLVDPLTASRVEFERVADVVAHEIAHMWFGDLVTMKWWNGIWLNEAFATFAEMACVDAFRPSWERWVTFGLTRSGAMATDELSTTRPIEFPVNRPEEAQGMFDVLTYEKGAGVLRMLEQYLGSDKFLAGLRKYLNAHLFGNAETTDLWDAIEEASGEPIRSVMDSWIFQGGHPVVSASLMSGPDGVSLRLTQDAFRLDASLAGKPTDSIGSDWQVPVTIRTVTDGTEESFKLLLGLDGAGLELSAEPDLVVVNANGTGFFRSDYDAILQNKLTANMSLLNSVEMFNLLSDTWALALCGKTSLDDFLSVTARLDSDDPNVWTTVVSHLGFLDLVAGASPSPDEARSKLVKFTQKVLNRRLLKIGLEVADTEDEKIGTLRSALVRGLGTFGADQKIRSWAAASFDSYRSDVTAIAPDLVGAVVATLAASNDISYYDVFLEKYRSPGTPQEEVRYLMSLPAFEDPELFAKTLRITLDEVRSQNYPF
ncbi:MAG TPA: M1 family metallopeptidase, partial [Acidimicrobiales bacterium]|nr:M1 family metallopeptidase [Acidimicrobiales bacterium]